MKTRRLSLIAGLVLASGVAIACNPATTNPAQLISDVTRGPGGSVSARDVGKVSYEKAKKGYRQTIAAYYTDNELAIDVRNADITFAPGNGKGPKGAPDAEGAVSGQTTVEVAVKKGKAHKITMSEVDYPPMGDTENVMQVDDTAAPQAMTYTADQEFMRFSLANAKGTKVAIVVNPDGTFSVDGKPAATVTDVAEQLRGSGVLKGVSVEHLAALNARLDRRQQAGTTLIGMNGGDDEPIALVRELIRQMQAGKAF